MKENTDVDVAGATIHLTGEQSIVYEFFFCLRFFPAFLVWTDLDWMSERRISQNFVIFASFLVNCGLITLIQSSSFNVKTNQQN